MLAQVNVFGSLVNQQAICLLGDHHVRSDLATLAGHG
jgi:hypothetical protein